MVILQKETRNLQSLGFRVPFQIQLTANTVQSVYPHSVSLGDSLRTYAQTCAVVCFCLFFRTPSICALCISFNSRKVIVECTCLSCPDVTFWMSQVTRKVQPLVAELQLDVQRTVESGIALKWESHRLDAYAKRLSDAVLAFHEKVCFLGLASFPFNRLKT